ncbi:hypothetical protein TomTYG75_30740 [Sphingobium sp. TomTYG75]
MRFSALALASLAFVNLSAGQVPHFAARSPYFCGRPPLGWKPPGQHKPALPSDEKMGCHFLMCGRKRNQARADGSCPT